MLLLWGAAWLTHIDLLGSLQSVSSALLLLLEVLCCFVFVVGFAWLACFWHLYPGYSAESNFQKCSKVHFSWIFKLFFLLLGLDLSLFPAVLNLLLWGRKRI